MTTVAPNVLDRRNMSAFADDDMAMRDLVPWVLGSLDEAEGAVEYGRGGVTEATMRAMALARDLEQLRVALALAGSGDGGYWAGRVARLEREAAMVEEAGRRGREWLDLARDPEGMGGGRVDVVEARIVEAADQWAGLVRQQRVALATRCPGAEEQAAMELEARAADLMRQQQVEMMEVTAVRNRVQGSEAGAEWRTMQAQQEVQRAELLEARAEESAARIEANARSHAEHEMRAAWRSAEEARAMEAAAARWWRFEGGRRAVEEMESRAMEAESAVSVVFHADWI